MRMQANTAGRLATAAFFLLMITYVLLTSYRNPSTTDDEQKASAPGPPAGSLPLWEQRLDFASLGFSNKTGNPSGCYVVPNYIHFVRFGAAPVNFIEFICILAAFKNQNPEKIFIHYDDAKTFSGKYWEHLQMVEGLLDIVVLNEVTAPDLIFGQPLSRDWKQWHGSDIMRINMIMKFGGIFLDNDCYLIKSLDVFRKFEITMNWDEGQYLASQVIVAHRDARFLRRWLECYKVYDSSKWYYNAGERPTIEVLYREPELIHRVQVEQVKAAGGKICLALITLGNIYIFLCWPQRRQCKMETETPLWSRDINFDSADIDNKTGTPDGSYLVPNHIHYIRFGRRRFTYTEMVCVLAAFKNQKPEKILFHRDHNQTFSGPYWDVLSRLKPFMDIVEFKYAPLPDQIFGQPIDQQVRKYHGSDITRIRILMEQGGIFLDNDVYVVKTLDEFRRYEMTLNWDRNQYLGTQVLLAHKDARFLRLWLDSYRGAYRGDIWYYNAGERPTETILLRRPELVHRVKVKFGADTGFIEKLFQRIWPGWRKMYALHLLINHQYLLSNLSRRATFPVVFNEKNIAHYPITFRDMAYDVYEIGRIMWAKKYKDD